MNGAAKKMAPAKKTSTRRAPKYRIHYTKRWIIAGGTVANDIKVCAPELPTLDKVIADLLGNGWGTLGKPLYKGLMSAGVSEERAVNAVASAAKVGLIVLRKGGGWCSWADKANRR